MVSLRQQVFVFLRNNPGSTSQELKLKFKSRPWNSVRTYRNQFWKEQDKSDISDEIKKKSIPPQNTAQEHQTIDNLESIENPVAYTTSHIFKRMVDTGDYRWAQLFVQVLEKTNKLDYETIREQEWLNQAKSMSMKELVERIAKKESISRSTLRRLDGLEDTSLYENL